MILLNIFRNPSIPVLIFLMVALSQVSEKHSLRQRFLRKSCAEEVLLEGERSKQDRVGEESSQMVVLVSIWSPLGALEHKLVLS
jgi:hypothetical protein